MTDHDCEKCQSSPRLAFNLYITTKKGDMHFHRVTDMEAFYCMIAALGFDVKDVHYGESTFTYDVLLPDNEGSH